MNVKYLKTMIADLPDDMIVYVFDLRAIEIKTMKHSGVPKENECVIYLQEDTLRGPNYINITMFTGTKDGETVVRAESTDNPDAMASMELP